MTCKKAGIVTVEEGLKWGAHRATKGGTRNQKPVACLSSGFRVSRKPGGGGTRSVGIHEMWRFDRTLTTPCGLHAPAHICSRMHGAAPQCLPHGPSRDTAPLPALPFFFFYWFFNIYFPFQTVFLLENGGSNFNLLLFEPS